MSHQRVQHTVRRRPPPRLTQGDIDRFWRCVDRSGDSECWPWLRCRSADGYGRFSVAQGTGRTLAYVAQRIAHLLMTGEWPEVVGHTCDNPPCCNPKHLASMTIGENVRDAASKRRMPHGDQHFTRRHPELVARGSRASKAKLTEEQVLRIRSDYANGIADGVRLAAQYGLDKSSIYAILTRRSWRHIP